MLWAYRKKPKVVFLDLTLQVPLIWHSSIQCVSGDKRRRCALLIVHSGGAHTGEGSERTGLPGLSRAVRQLDLQTRSAPEVDFCASSIGSLNDSFLQTVYTAVQGDDSHAVLSKSGAKDKKNTSTAQGSSHFAKFRRKAFRIYFPTHGTVANSTGGVDNAGTICLSSKWYDAEAFPRDMMRDYRSKRKGLLSHNKVGCSKRHLSNMQSFVRCSVPKLDVRGSKTA